jgi:hypothetical protein
MISINGISYRPADTQQDKNLPSKLFEIGKQYFIRSIPYHAVGRCVAVIDGFVVLEDASWVADSGRLYDALTDGIEKQDSSELEPIPGLLFKQISAIDEFTEYKPKLVVKQK